MSVNREVGTVHTAQIAATALLWRDYMRRVVALGVEGRGKREHFGGAELYAEAARFAAFDHDGNASFCHEYPRGIVDSSTSVRAGPAQPQSSSSEALWVSLSQEGVTPVTGCCEVAYGGKQAQIRGGGSAGRLAGNP